MIRRLILLFLYVVVTAVVLHCGKEPEQIQPVQKVANRSETPHETLIAMGDYNYPPFEFYDESGNPSGFNIDIIRSVAETMNLKIDITLGVWSEVRRSLEDRKIDIVTGMFKTPERDKKVDFTIPHFISTYVIFARDGSGIRKLDDIKGKTVIVQEGDLGHDFMLENGTAGKIITKPELQETLIALSRGEGDCVIAALMQGQILLDRFDIDNVKPLPEPVLQRSYCIAVKDGDAKLLARLNEGLNIIKTSGEYDRIYEKWFSVYETKRFFDHPYFRILFPVFAIILVSAIITYVWNILLHRKLREKVDALKTELENSNVIRSRLQESMEELARSKEEALQSKIEAEKSSEAKSYFLAGVSHELRTPLNGIIGMTNLLSGTDLTAEQRSLLDMLKASADNLFRLMADLLEFSRVASGKFRFEISPVNLGEFVENTSSVIRLMAEEKGLSFEVKNSSPSVNLLIDKDRLGQVVFNVAGNAVKFTENGLITLDVSYNGQLHLSVSDTGIGMDSDSINAIFDPFMQIGEGGTFKNRGLGLGLAIVKLIVETFGGTIDVRSIPGAGSTFTINIPCREAVNQAVGRNAALKDGEVNTGCRPAGKDSLAVLIVEDDRINRIYLERLLEKKKWDIDITDKGDEAVEKSKTKHYDLILMDLNLPGFDGLTAAKMIREFEDTHSLPHSAIIAVTAHAYPEDMVKCTRAGMDGYLSKPFSSGRLIEEIERILGC